MKTALIRTGFWKDDSVFELSIDARMLYLCLLTNPDRDTTPAFKCSDRMLSAYTGFNNKQIEVARKDLVEKEKIFFVEGYYILNNQDFVESKKGKLTTIKYQEDFMSLPIPVQEIVLKNKSFSSRATLEPLKSIVIETVIVKETEKVTEWPEVVKAFESIDSKNKTYYKNTTQQKAAKFLVEEYGKENVIYVIENVLPLTNKRPRYEFPHISDPDQLMKNWTKVKDGITTKKQEKKTLQDSVAF